MGLVLLSNGKLDDGSRFVTGDEVVPLVIVKYGVIGTVEISMYVEPLGTLIFWVVKACVDITGV